MQSYIMQSSGREAETTEGCKELLDGFMEHLNNRHVQEFLTQNLKYKN